MKIASLIARYLLGLVFLVFGLNGFLHFIPVPPPPPGAAGQFMGAMLVSKYLVVVFLIELIGGALLLSGRYVPLALTLLAPIIVNIVLYHVTMAPGDLTIAILVTIFWVITALSVKSAFAPLLQARTA